MTAGGAINTQKTVVCPLPKRRVANIKLTAGVPEREPLGLIGYLTVGGLEFYQGKLNPRGFLSWFSAHKAIKICKKLSFKLTP